MLAVFVEAALQDEKRLLAAERKRQARLDTPVEKPVSAQTPCKSKVKMEPVRGKVDEEGKTAKLVDAAHILIYRLKMAGLRPILLFGRKRKGAVFSECLSGLEGITDEQRGVVRAIQILYKSLLSDNEEDLRPEQQDQSSNMDQEEPNMREEDMCTKMEQPEVTAVADESAEDEEKPDFSRRRRHHQRHTEENSEDFGESEPSWNSGQGGHLRKSSGEQGDYTTEPEESEDDGKEINELCSETDDNTSVVFSCHDCGREFRRNCDLRKHETLHSQEKTFSGSRWGKLKNTRSQGREKPFSCSNQCVGEMNSTAWKPIGDQMEPEHLGIKEEEEDVYIHQKEADVHAVTLQSEEEEEKPMYSHLHRESDTEENHGGPEPSWNSGPGDRLKPGTEDGMEYSSETEDSESYEATIEPLWLKSEENTTASCDVREETDEIVSYSEFGEQLSYNTLSMMDEGHRRNLVSCPECGKEFTDRRNLIPHMRIHSGDKPFGCSVCGKRFTQKGHLTMHEKIHSEERLFSCSECGKKFRHKQDIWRHEKIHTGWKPYSCSQCGIRFTHRFNLTAHEKIHTGERLFSCDECGKTFRRMCDVGRHKKTHTGAKPFSCSECDKTFTERSSLKRHEKCIHDKDI